MIQTRSGIIHDKKAIGRWLESLPAESVRCWFCAEPFDGFAHRMTVHHIAGGAGRSDEPTNFVVAGLTCHMAIEGKRPVVNGVAMETISLATVLTAKLCLDPEHYDPKRLAVLLGRALPDEMDHGGEG